MSIFRETKQPNPFIRPSVFQDPDPLIKPEPQPGEIWVADGRYMAPLKSAPDTVFDIETIALVLSRTPRFTGHTDREVEALSVAEHSTDTALLAKKLQLSPTLEAVALLHDAAEAYLNEMARPVKYQPELEGYRRAEDVLQARIFESFGLLEAAQKWRPLVKGLDHAQLAREKASLIPDAAGPWPDFPDLPRFTWAPMTAKDAETAFLEYAMRLGLT